MSPDAQAWDEEPAFIKIGSEDIFCVLTRPRLSANGIGVVLATGSGWMPATDRNRMGVRLARRLAGRGFHVVRFEYHGVGESSGTMRGYRLRRPFTKQVDGAADVLRSRGVSKITLIGNCYGSRTVLASARGVSELSGVGLITPPIYNSPLQKMTVELEAATANASAAPSPKADGSRARTVKQRAVDAAKVTARWLMVRVRSLSRAEREERTNGEAAPAFIDGLSGLLKRKVPILLLMGDADDHYSRYLTACEGRLGTLMRDAGSLIDVRILPGKVHGLSRIDTQGEIIDIVDGWLGAEKLRESGVPSVAPVSSSDETHDELARQSKGGST